MPTFLSFPKSFVRMARQHKATAVAWVAALLSLGIAVTGISVFALRAERARDREQEQQELAEENAAEARAAIAAERNQRERPEQQRKTESLRSLPFSLDGRRLAAALAGQSVRLWGLTDACIMKDRTVSHHVQDQIRPAVEGWFAEDPSTVKQKLAVAKATLSEATWQQAANLVLSTASAQASGKR